MSYEPGRLQAAAQLIGTSEFVGSIAPTTRSVTLRIRAFTLLALIDSFCIIASFVVAALQIGRAHV